MLQNTMLSPSSTLACSDSQISSKIFLTCSCKLRAVAGWASSAGFKSPQTFHECCQAQGHAVLFQGWSSQDMQRGHFMRAWVKSMFLTESCSHLTPSYWNLSPDKGHNKESVWWATEAELLSEHAESEMCLVVVRLAIPSRLLIIQKENWNSVGEENASALCAAVFGNLQMKCTLTD